MICHNTTTMLRNYQCLGTDEQDDSGNQVFSTFLLRILSLVFTLLAYF